jgi:drug/metabolite transporter (DMT)-like permease
VSYARRAWIVFHKDLLVERRSKEQTNALLFFCLLLLFLFQFALGPDRERLASALPGLLWLGFILASSGWAGASSSSARTTAGRASGSRRATSPPSTSASSRATAC